MAVMDRLREQRRPLTLGCCRPWLRFAWSGRQPVQNDWTEDLYHILSSLQGAGLLSTDGYETSEI